MWAVQGDGVRETEGWVNIVCWEFDGGDGGGIGLWMVWEKFGGGRGEFGGQTGLEVKCALSEPSEMAWVK